MRHTPVQQHSSSAFYRANAPEDSRKVNMFLKIQIQNDFNCYSVVKYPGLFKKKIRLIFNQNCRIYVHRVKAQVGKGEGLFKVHKLRMEFLFLPTIRVHGNLNEIIRDHFLVTGFINLIGFLLRLGCYLFFS